jgi:hypothetical protein
MTARTHNGRGQLQIAMNLLIQNQAQFLAQIAEINRRTDERFARLEARLEERFARIEALLLRHEQILQNLPEAIREKIGFKRR